MEGVRQTATAHSGDNPSFTMPALPTIALMLPETISPYLYLMLAGFVVGIFGHLMKLKIVIGLGILMIASATLLLPLTLVLSEESPPSRPGIYAPGTK